MTLTLRLLAVCGVIAAALAQPWPGLPRAHAQSIERRVPTENALRWSYAPVVKRVAPAVVNVYAAKVVRNQNPLFDDPIFRHFFGVPGGGRQVQRSLGSGVIVDPRGLVVTNMHVIRGADEIKVALADKREFEASVVLKDPRSDLAVLRIKDSHERFPFLQFANSDALEVGDVVIAIGNPFGVGQTVTHGIISALARTDVGTSDYQFFIQTDAAINPGNSGGALVDLDGRLVGINSAIFSRSGGWQGIGFAIPSNMVKVVVTSAEGGSHAVRRPWLGADLQTVTPEIADSMGLNRPVGALVASVTRGSPAEQAGLQPGDLIRSIDGQSVEDVKAFNYRFATKPLGETAQLGVLRKGHMVTASVPLRTAPSRPRDEVTIRSRSPLSGATVANLSPALADELGLDDAD
ncbi:MAG TPA: Do family serine endopeptidase, partial [Pseudolabrys sp.]|nr:Do family serine endopeptidase [Pseudolabrys sp.]